MRITLRAPDLLGEPHRSGVDRLGEGVGQRDRAPGRRRRRCAAASRRPRAAPPRSRSSGRRPVLERGQIDEQLERRAGLALGLGRAVELALRVVAAAEHRAHLAVRRHRHQRRLLGLGAGLREGALRPPPRPPACTRWSRVVATSSRGWRRIGVEPALGRHPVGEVAAVGARRRAASVAGAPWPRPPARRSRARPRPCCRAPPRRAAGERQVAGRRVIARAPGSRPRAAPIRRATARSRAWRSSASRRHRRHRRRCRGRAG